MLLGILCLHKQNLSIAYSMDSDNPVKPGNTSSGDIENVQLLIFKIMDVYFGADMEQIEEMIEPPPGLDPEDIPAFHEVVPFRGDAMVYKTPKVLLIKDGKEVRPLKIDQAVNIVNVSVNAIQLFPTLLEGHIKSEALWGVAFVDENLVLLVDLYKIPKQSRVESS